MNVKQQSVVIIEIMIFSRLRRRITTGTKERILAQPDQGIFDVAVVEGTNCFPIVIKYFHSRIPAYQQFSVAWNAAVTVRFKYQLAALLRVNYILEWIFF